MPVTASFNGQLQLTDNLAGDTSLLKALILSFTGVSSAFSQSVLIGTGATSLNIPNAIAQFVYIRNLSTTVGNYLNVNWTPRGGSGASIINLSPGSAILLTESDTTNGISAISLVAFAANTPVEYLLAG